MELGSWTIYDRKKDQIELVWATTWKEAIIKSGDEIIPRRHVDLRPRTGDYINSAPTKKEFRDFMRG